MEIEIGKTYVLNQDVEMAPQPYVDRIMHVGKKGQKAVVLTVFNGLCLVGSVNHNFYVRPDQLENLPSIKEAEEKTSMKLNLEFLPSSVKKGDIIGSALYDGEWYDVVFVGDNGNNFKLVEQAPKTKIPNNNKIQADC
jgi:hypothetical protein